MVEQWATEVLLGQFDWFVEENFYTHVGCRRCWEKRVVTSKGNIVWQLLPPHLKYLSATRCTQVSQENVLYEYLGRWTVLHSVQASDHDLEKDEFH